MNKDLIDLLPADEQPIASVLHSLAEEMQPSSSFQWELETRLMEKTKTPPQRGWHTRIMPAMVWAALLGMVMLLLNWSIRALAPGTQPAAGQTPVPEVPFEASVRQGDLCPGPLALVHDFAAFLTNEEKTSFVRLDTADSIGEVRSFAWSADGMRLAIIGNTTGSGTIYITEPTGGGQVEYVLSGQEAGYLWDATWSRDGRQFVIWSSPTNALYLLDIDGAGLVEKKVGVQILGTPQFPLDGKSVIFYGGDMTATGLFELNLDNSQITLINPAVHDESGFAFSPDGSHLAYMEYDRAAGETRLFAEDLTTGERTILGTLPISRNSGSSLPEVSNLSWSPDGTFLVFDLAQPGSGQAIFIAPADGSGWVQVAASGYAPTVSPDGRCLAYISDKGVFLIDLADLASSPTTAAPIRLADLPAGRGRTAFKLDKLQWKP